MEFFSGEGFIVHAYADSSRNRVHILGRLSDGRSFAASTLVPPLSVHIRPQQAVRAAALFLQSHLPVVLEQSSFILFDGSAGLRLAAPAERDIARGTKLLRQNLIEVFGADVKSAAAFLIRNGIRGGLLLSGGWRPGQGVDMVFPDPKIEAAHDARAVLSVMSLDIETEEPSGRIRAVGLSRTGDKPGRSRVLLFAGVWSGAEPPDADIAVYPDERTLLVSLAMKIREMDPDIITGWNVIDFDFPRLAAAFDRHRLPFSLGRSVEAGRFFPAESDSSAGGDSAAKRSASVFLPGRQVLDALRLVRTGYESFDSYTLDSVANAVLGRGKTVRSTDSDKLAELDRLYADEPLTFCRYCLNDADLVLDILDKRELIKHTVERAALTGSGIDKAWTSVASFERVYAEGLHERGIIEPNADPGRNVSGAAGGTVLDPVAGLFSGVAVFDFRSLYPSIMRTFNIDPFAHERARAMLASASSDDSVSTGDLITAPNGAAFVRERGILPALIAQYFTERIAAIDRGDDAAAFVYKILMNSFYGVLGTPKCRYARTELAGAITSFGKLCLHYARDFFREKGFRVLYGDTDSVFVEMKRESGIPFALADYAAYAAELNEGLSAHIMKTYRLESFIGIRFEKLYTRFFIPRLRMHGKDETVEELERGRAKGYAGLIVSPDGSGEVEIKGMEAARSDYTPLARRFQREMLRVLFTDSDTLAVEAFIKEQTEALYAGKLDAELAFKKTLRRITESYTASTPPHIKVARALGWKNRRGTVEFLITVNGPEALSQLRSPIDYAWYASSQLLPTAASVGTAAGFDAEAIILSVSPEGQLELGL